MSKDYYKILGIEKGASKDEIKKAFRKKAHEFHPDKATGDEAKFKEINEAYQVLSDEQKRAQYDQFGQTFNGGAGPGAGGFGGFGGGHGFNVNFEDLGDIFGDFFGGGGARGSQARVRGQDIQMDIKLSFKESIFGVEKEISVNKHNDCDRCGGNGAEPGTSMKTCPDCSGSGFTIHTRHTILGAMQSRVTCATCDGSGEIPEQACTACHGAGTIYGRKSIRVNIPPGVEQSNRIRVRNQGEAVKGGDAGDLYLVLHVEHDPRFEKVGENIVVNKKIGFTQAALGDEVQVDTVDGKVKLKIPAGTQSGDKLRLKGKGVPYNRGRGDQIVMVNVETPKKLSRHQKKLLDELDLRI